MYNPEQYNYDDLFAKKLDEWITGKQDSVRIKFAREGLPYSDLFLKCFAYAALNEEFYTKGYMRDFNLEKEDLYALLGEHEECQEYFLEEIGNIDVPDFSEYVSI